MAHLQAVRRLANLYVGCQPAWPTLYARPPSSTPRTVVNQLGEARRAIDGDRIRTERASSGKNLPG